MNDPRYKFAMAALLLVVIVAAGWLAVIDKTTTQVLLVGITSWAVGYGMNGFGKINAGFANLESTRSEIVQTVADTVRTEMEPFVARLCAAEDRIGIATIAAVDRAAG